MLKIVVVDDEELIRGKIVNLLKNSGIKLDIVYEAGNGQEALEFVRAGEIPDIIITDVRMPVMTGLELIETMNINHPGIKFIVVSGYAEFEYAVKAMQFGVTNYVLKPVKSKELINIIEKMLDEIKKTKQEKATMMQTESVLCENRHMVFEKKLYSFLTTHKDDQDLQKSLISEYFILKQSFYVISIINIGKRNKNEVNIGIQLPDMENCDFYNIICKYIGDEQKEICIIENFARKDAYILIFGGTNVHQINEKARKATNMIFRRLYESYHLSITIGVSDACNDLKTAYKNSVSALKQRFLLGTNKVIFYGTNASSKNKTSESFAFKVKLVEKGLDNTSLINAKRILMEFAQEVFADNIAQYLKETSIDYLFNEYINIIIRFGLKNNFDVMEIIGTNVISGKILECLDDKDDILEVFQKTIENIFSYQIESSENDQDYILNISNMDRIISYINKNINDEISLQTISEKFTINSSYLSRIFKATTGQGFVQYITNIKIEKAKDLLKNSGMDISEIALCLGFSDQQYFNRVFKKTTGYTPNEVRNLSKKNPKIL